MTKSEKIRKAYIEFMLENGKQPESVYAFAKKLKIKEEEFYEEYNSFVQLENGIWKGFFEEAKTITVSEEIYNSYSVREKILAFYFTWIEVLKRNRSFVLKAVEGLEKPIFRKKNMQFSDFKNAHYDFINDLLLEARETQEVENRQIPQLMKSYPDLFWAKTLFILDFWVNDVSKGFEKTDTAIEKIVNTAFDWLGKSPLDSLFDLGKFLFQNRK